MNKPISPQLPVETLPWYRQFWPWFVMALPASVVVASFITLAIAILHADEVVRDDYYKDGLAINQQLDREHLARAMNLQAALTWEPDSGEIRVQLATRADDPQLMLHWLHPLKQQLDRDIVLTRRDNTQTEGTLYGGQVDAPLDGRFYVQLENVAKDASAAWRLHGEITAAAHAISANIILTP